MLYRPWWAATGPIARQASVRSTEKFVTPMYRTLPAATTRSRASIDSSVGVEATETLIDLLPDRCRAQIVADRSRVVPEEPALASDQDAVAATRQGLPEHLLGVAKSVDRGDVKVGNPEIDGGPDRPDGLLVGASVPRASAADPPAAEADGREGEIGHRRHSLVLHGLSR